MGDRDDQGDQNGQDRTPIILTVLISLIAYGIILQTNSAKFYRH